MGLVLLLSTLALIVEGLQQSSYLRAAGPPAAGRVQLDGLRAPARLIRDAFAVPHIHAGDTSDAFRALGFVHAQDRLWQMEVLRRTAHGRLSEVFGDATLPQDRLARTLGLGRAAREEAEALPERPRELLHAYAQGVNAWMDEVRGQPRWGATELRWLDLDPEPWTIADTLAIVRLRAFLLSRSLGASLLLERLNRQLGGSGSQDFFPAQPPAPPQPEIVGSLRRIGGVADALAHGVGLRGARVGSLGFIVGSARSKSGKPLLANDPHVEFQAPALFYFAHIETPKLSVAGGTWPGVPVFWMGHNRHVAWGQVALHAVVADLFDETLKPDEPGLYRVSGKWVPLEQRIERIEVRGRDPQLLQVSRSRHGPLLGSLLPDDPTVAGYSLRWTGAAPESGIQGSLRLQRARDWAEFRAALRSIPSPPATFLYADTSGNTGTQAVGHLPLRMVPPGLLSVPGEYDWSGLVPFHQLPSSFGNATAARVVSTRGDGTPFAHPTEWLWEDGGAAQRIAARLKADAPLSFEDVLEIQRERFSERGVASVRELLGDLEPTTDAGRRVAEILRAWSGSTDTDQIGVSVYHVFRQRLGARLLQERLGSHPEILQLAREAEPMPGLVLARFLDRVKPARASSLVDEALAETGTWLGIEVSANPKRWAWGELHRVRLLHAFERLGSTRLAWAGRWLGRGPFPAPGDPDSAWTMYHGALPTKSVALGPAARYAVDLGDLDHAEFGLAGGQSGHPGSPHYDDGLSEWLRGRARPLWMHRIDVAYHEAGRWELEPK